MQRDDEVGCATEVAEGTAYQSWDWSNEAREGSVFQEIDSERITPWQNAVKEGLDFKEIDLKKSNLWRNALEAGDSLWHQQAWDCRTKVETIGRYGTLTVKDLDWIFLRTEFFRSVIFSDSPNWLVVKWNQDEILKLSEFTKLGLNTFQEDNFILSDPSYLHSFLIKNERGIFSERFKAAFTKRFPPDSCQLQDLLKFVSEISLNEETSQIDESHLVDVNYPLAEIFKTADRFSIIGRIRVTLDLGLFNESRRVRIFKTLFESLKLGETFSAAFVEGGYGVSGYGVVGYGV